MVDLASLVPPLVLQNLSLTESRYLCDVFDRFDGYPRLEQVWQLMDEQWLALGCDPLELDERVTEFYRHPVWILNGLFIEQDRQSLEHRRIFAEWVARHRPTRVADFGGGFGGLARGVAALLPDTNIEVVEPHPHAAAAAMSLGAPNLSFVSGLNGEYDMLIATDVFEHVEDPIGAAGEAAMQLRRDGRFLIANCFQPVILCHLPQLFYLNIAWDLVMEKMGLDPLEPVQYGRAFRRRGSLDMAGARRFAHCARRLYPWVKWVPKNAERPVRALIERRCRRELL